MVDSEYSTNNYKFLQISTQAITKSSKILRLVSDHFKTKRMCKNTVKKLSFVIRYVFYQYKTKQTSDNFIL